MKLYVKLTAEDTSLIYAPLNIERNGYWVCNYNFECNEEMLFEDGWKALVEAEKPEVPYYIYYEQDEHHVYERIHIYTEEELKELDHLHVLTLKCTKRVFALILTQMGVTYEQLKALIATDERAQLEWDLCVELSRDNPLLDLMAKKLGFTSEVVDYIFKYANGEISQETLLSTLQASREQESTPLLSNPEGNEE